MHAAHANGLKNGRSLHERKLRLDAGWIFSERVRSHSFHLRKSIEFGIGSGTGLNRRFERLCSNCIHGNKSSLGTSPGTGNAVAKRSAASHDREGPKTMHLCHQSELQDDDRNVELFGCTARLCEVDLQDIFASHSSCIGEALAHEVSARKTLEALGSASLSPVRGGEGCGEGTSLRVPANTTILYCTVPGFGSAPNSGVGISRSS